MKDGMVLINRYTLAWIRIHIARADASKRAISETIAEIDEALKGPLYQEPQKDTSHD